METLNRNQNRSLNGKLKGDLNENRNGNLNGNPNGKLNGNWGRPDRNLNEPNLGPNWNQQASLGVHGRSLGIPGWSLGAPWSVLGGSLERPWGLPRRVLGEQNGTQGWTSTGPAPGTQQVPKVCNTTGPGTSALARGGTRFCDPQGTL